MLNLSSEILRLLMHEHREIKKYEHELKHYEVKTKPAYLARCKCELDKHTIKRDVYIEVLSLVNQFLDQIE